MAVHSLHTGNTGFTASVQRKINLEVCNKHRTLWSGVALALVKSRRAQMTSTRPAGVCGPDQRQQGFTSSLSMIKQAPEGANEHAYVTMRDGRGQQKRRGGGLQRSL